MKELFLNYPEALTLKELGFDKPCLARFFDDETFIIDDGELSLNQAAQSFNFCCLAPTFSQAFKWFRDNYKLFAWAYYVDSKTKGVPDCRYVIYYYDQNPKVSSKNYKTFEEAELECLRKLILIIKEQKK